MEFRSRRTTDTIIYCLYIIYSLKYIEICLAEILVQSLSLNVKVSKYFKKETVLILILNHIGWIDIFCF